MAKAREADPASELASLQASLAGGKLARGYVLRGEERYFRERAIDLLKHSASLLGHELCLHDARKEKDNTDFHLARLIDDLSGGGLFAARRLVLVRNPGELLKKIDGEDSPLTRAALAFLRAADDPGCLVLSDAGLRSDHALAKTVLERGGSVLALRKLWDTPPPWKPDPRQSELVLWTERRARELGLSLSSEQALYVAAATGNDLFALDDQLEVLRSSGVRALKDVVRWTAAGTPWAVADHLLAGDLGRGLAGIEGLFSAGFQEKDGRRLVDSSALAAMLVSALQRGARSALEVAHSAGRALDGEGSAMHKAAVARAGLRSADDWRELLEETAALERCAKTGHEIDCNEFTRLALRWSLVGAARSTPARPRR